MAEKVKTFEQQLQQLEVLVQKMDSEDVPLETAIKHYEEGVRISAQLNKILDHAQRRVEILSNKGGETQAEPFPEEETDPS